MIDNLLFQAGATTGALIGFLFGMLFTLFIVYYIYLTNKIDTARYIQRLSKEKKEKVTIEIKALKKQLREVAEITNTKFFNSMLNELNSLSQRINKKWVP